MAIDFSTLRPDDATVTTRIEDVLSWFQQAIEGGYDRHGLGVFAACLKMLHERGGMVDVSLPELSQMLNWEFGMRSPRPGIIRLMLDDGGNDDDLQEGIENECN